MDRWDPPTGRRYYWEAIPDELVGADYVITFNNDKKGSAWDVSYSVTVGQATTLYVFVDQRHEEDRGDPPFPWLTDGSSGVVFIDTGLDITLNELGGSNRLEHFDVYGAQVPAGTYTLGSVWQSRKPGHNFYAIAAVGIWAEVEIKPETLNLKSKGVFTAFIDLPEGYDEEDIDISTVECEGADAVSGVIANDDKLIVKFDRKDLVGVSAGNAVELIVTGQLLDGTVFSGSDTIKVK